MIVEYLGAGEYRATIAGVVVRLEGERHAVETLARHLAVLAATRVHAADTCPRCKRVGSRVQASRGATGEDVHTWRRRECRRCGARWSTIELATGEKARGA